MSAPARRPKGPRFDPYAPGQWARRVPIKRLPVRVWRSTSTGELVRRGVTVRTQRCLLYAMATACDPDGSNVYLAVSTLAQFADCDERTARAGLRSLERQGLIRADRPSRGGRRASRYSLVMGPQSVEGEGEQKPGHDAPVSDPGHPAPPAEIPGHAAPPSGPENTGTGVPPVYGHERAPLPALDPVPPLGTPPRSTDNDEPASAGAARQIRPGCTRHRSRRRRECRDCRATPTPARYVPPAAPPPGTAERGLAAVRAVLAGNVPLGRPLPSALDESRPAE